MTNTEIIEKIKGYKGIIMYPTDDAEALKDAAISALEKIPKYRKKYKRWKRKALSQEPCEDAVSREDAVHALRKALWDYEDKTEKQFRERDELDYEEWYFHRIFVQAMNDEDVEAICKLPSVNVRQTGEWIDSSNGWMCSECNRDNTFDTNYCPNCGADMRTETWHGMNGDIKMPKGTFDRIFREAKDDDLPDDI